MRKSLFYVTMLALVLTLLLAACGNNNNGANKEEPSNTKDTTNTNEPSTDKPEVRGSLSSAIYDRGEVPAAEGTIEDNRWTKWIIENGPADVDFQAIPRWESLDKYNVLFASGQAPDLIYEFKTDFRDQLINAKQLMPIQDLIEEHSVEYKAMLEEYPILRKIATRDDGNMYEFGRLNGMLPNHGLLIRKDWLDNLGLSVPKTVDDLYKVAEAFTKGDPDKNGADDTLGMGAAFVSQYILDAMFQGVEYKIQDGKMVRAWENKQAEYEFIKKLYENGIIDKDFLLDKNGENEKQNFITGKLGIYGTSGVASNGTLGTYEALKKNIPNAQVMTIELPASEFGQFSPVIGSPVQATAAINANAKDPATIIKYVDFLVKESTQKMLRFGEEGVHWQNDANNCPVPIDQEKNKAEQTWTGDMRMLVSQTIFGDCWKIKNSLDPNNNPVHKEFIAIVDQAEAAYLSPDRPIADVTLGEYMPAIPADLSTIRITSGGNYAADGQFVANLNKAVVSGSKYSVEQAIKDNQANWESAGGAKVDAWYEEWYQSHKDTSIMAKDIYTIFK